MADFDSVVAWVLIGIVVVAVIVSLAWRAVETREQQRYERDRAARSTVRDHQNTVFVAIPCLRDEGECARTLFSLFNEADCPWRVTAGVLHHVIDEHAPGPLDTAISAPGVLLDHVLGLYEQLCSQRKATSFANNIRILVRPASEAEGPAAAWAAIEQHLFRGERYYMTATSRTRFARGWDALALKLLAECPPRTVLTTAPGEVDLGTGLPVDPRPTYPVASAHPDGFPEVQGIPFEATPSRCIAGPVWWPGCSFAPARLVKEVPADPALVNLEEQAGAWALAARYWTHGWDFAVPREPLCFQGPPKPPDGPRPSRAYVVEARARALALFRRDRCSVCDTPRDEHGPAAALGHQFAPTFAGSADVHRTHGLGQARPLAAFEAHAGVSIGRGVEAKARLGCHDDANEEEVMCKYGSREVYNVLRQQLGEPITRP